MKPIVFISALLLTCTMLAQDSTVPAADSKIREIPQTLAAAWEQADAKAMAALFADDADLVIPSGNVLSGRPAIQAFYQSVFEHGYKGSHAGSEISRIRVAGAMAIVDGVWSINGARDATGATRPAEQGLFTAILEKQAGQWRVMALREMVPAGN